MLPSLLYCAFPNLPRLRNRILPVVDGELVPKHYVFVLRDDATRERLTAPLDPEVIAGVREKLGLAGDQEPNWYWDSGQRKAKHRPVQGPDRRYLAISLNDNSIIGMDNSGHQGKSSADAENRTLLATVKIETPWVLVAPEVIRSMEDRLRVLHDTPHPPIHDSVQCALEFGEINKERAKIPLPRLVGCSIRYALIHLYGDNSLSTHDKPLSSRRGLIHALKTRTDICCCIVLEAEIRQCGLYTYRSDVVAAASFLMSLTSLTEVRTCITDGRYWMFGRLWKKQDDGCRVFMDTDPLPLEPPDYRSGPYAFQRMRSQLSTA
ncbi:hypothetical protein C8T65DRAFT_697632 [Cerioporus squamosus]|nr:hypothetical protein C8T65DRAFT_697632 [Cerioporus squamosus]